MKKDVKNTIKALSQERGILFHKRWGKCLERHGWCWGRKLGFGGAGLAGAMDGEVGAGDFGASREVPELGGVEIGGWVGVDDLAAGLTMEMDVLVEVRAVA